MQCGLKGVVIFGMKCQKRLDAYNGSVAQLDRAADF